MTKLYHPRVFEARGLAMSAARVGMRIGRDNRSNRRPPAAINSPRRAGSRLDGNIRVRLEDSLWLARLAKSNAE